MNNEKEINSHFLQKALVKNFAQNGEIKWTKYPNGKAGIFNINSNNSKQPIAIKGFYSYDIEKGMNNLESEGIKVIRKISQDAQFKKEIILSRKELITLRFYSFLSGARTSKLRNNISNKTGDTLFNSMIDNANESPKDIQQKMIRTILKYWEEGKNGLLGDVHNDLYSTTHDNKSDEVINSVLTNISITLKSRLLIFKFDSNNLLLTEALNFTEQNQMSGGILLSFMPIFSNVGIAFYFDPVVMRTMDITKQKSVIFKNDISNIRNKTEYKNIKIIEEKQHEYLKNSKNIDRDNKRFTLTEARKYYDKNDKYIYKVLQESEEVANTCNAMALAHCKDAYVIFQNKKDIEKAEETIKIKGIYRIEDHR